ncbi:Pyridoxal biosynthesis protein PDX2 [Auxenochlorella protothecoides]|uniref:glutaminase n=2 Tax=Auxenochlorella protothecoides TaxID=3075 RepID=A0A087ST57_AUXPR|nr:Pyridoxal biosynthesis protein PDX2 [Auxenochlorella protothecoides]KFM28911.1 Pyridoxal biosynthesis protein PDX2 [Auxenochlorella protothecoides]RMZ57624.1 hypothetical protein APUTEX25_001824 [Auxenochlorella protothecoides]|eukprot:RMZ57624.1 hypothetical protein APUTEX25_001824 [Auxenochlorella protothecoides]
MNDAPADSRIGVLALQGAFREHVTSLQSLPGVEAVEVRTKEQLDGVDGLIIPGGESTTMALVAERWGLIPELQRFTRELQRPVWGTCAGLIFLADRAVGTKTGGQALLGGLDVTVARNFFGAQIHSFETRLTAPECLLHAPTAVAGQPTFRALFIRAPAILETGPGVEVLARYHLTPEEAAEDSSRPASVVVAVRSGHLLATSFHPELVGDARWHALFADMVRETIKGKQREERQAREVSPLEARKPRDLPKH